MRMWRCATPSTPSWLGGVAHNFTRLDVSRPLSRSESPDRAGRHFPVLVRFIWRCAPRARIHANEPGGSIPPAGVSLEEVPEMTLERIRVVRVFVAITLWPLTMTLFWAVTRLISTRRVPPLSLSG